jgi:hypothetical protein
MKIRTDFVTNSSSVGYVIVIDPDELDGLKEFVEKLDKHEDASNEGVRFGNIFETKQQLDEHTNDGPLDWARLPGGPRFINKSQSKYNELLEHINEGSVICYVLVDREICDEFEIYWRDRVIQTDSL